MDYGLKIEVQDNKLRFGGKTYERVATHEAEAVSRKNGAACSANTAGTTTRLVILEREGKLHALIEWFFLYPLEEVSANEFKFPEYGLYLGEKLIFTRDDNGRATRVEAASVVFERRKIDGENGETFKIKPLHPVAELRRAALAGQAARRKRRFPQARSGRTDPSR